LATRVQGASPTLPPVSRSDTDKQPFSSALEALADPETKIGRGGHIPDIDQIVTSHE